MGSPLNLMRKPGASQHGGDLFSCCDGGHYSPAWVQLWIQNHSNCNLKPRRSINFNPQVEGDTPTTTLPAGSTPRQHFNNSSSSHRGQVSGCHGWVLRQHREIGGTVTGTFVEVEIDVSTEPALKLTISAAATGNNDTTMQCPKQSAAVTSVPRGLPPSNVSSLLP